MQEKTWDIYIPYGVPRVKHNFKIGFVKFERLNFRINYF